MRNAVNLLTFIGGITEAVGVNDFMLGVGENRKTNCALAVRGDFRGKVPAYIRRVDANREQFYVFILL